MESIEEEGKPFDIFEQQHGNCFLCGQPLAGWILQDFPNGQHVICWPSCNDKLPASIKLTVKDGKIVRADY